MKRDYYYLKEVLLGLREEYLKNEERLEQLKSYVICKDERIEDFYFFLSQNKEIGTEFWIYFQEKDNLFDYLKKLIGLDFRNCYGLLEKDSFSEGYSIKQYPREVGVDSAFIDQFDQDIRHILESDFVKEMPLEKRLFRNQFAIQCKLSKMWIRTPKFYLSYYPSELETLYLYNLVGSQMVTKEFMESVFQMEIPREYFSSYHQELIDNLDVTSKEIVLDEKGIRSLNTEFTFAGEDGIIEDRLILGRKKSLKKI